MIGKSAAQYDAAADDMDRRSGVGALMDIELPVTLHFGRKLMLLEEVLQLQSGSAIELDRRTDEPIEVVVNGRVVARGEAVTVQDSYAVRILEISSRSAAPESDTAPAGELG